MSNTNTDHFLHIVSHVFNKFAEYVCNSGAPCLPCLCCIIIITNANQNKNEDPISYMVEIKNNNRPAMMPYANSYSHFCVPCKRVCVWVCREINALLFSYMVCHGVLLFSYMVCHHIQNMNTARRYRWKNIRISQIRRKTENERKMFVYGNKVAR